MICTTIGPLPIVSSFESVEVTTDRVAILVQSNVSFGKSMQRRCWVAQEARRPSEVDRNCVRFFERSVLLGGLLLCIGSLGGCAALEPPRNNSVELFDLEKTGEQPQNTLSFNAMQCPPAGTSNFLVSPRPRRKPVKLSPEIRYSPGDRVNVFVTSAQEFSGDYVVGSDGAIRLPFVPGLIAVGLTGDELAMRIQYALVKHKMFAANEFRVSVRSVQFSSVNITVAGAVFLPGRISIGGARDPDKGEKAVNKFGDNPSDRDVAAALRGAGGVRPDADLQHVTLHRNNQRFDLDWRGALIGQPVDDIVLVGGDHIEVAEASCFQSGLVRPSQITPPGIRIFQSNLTQPVNSNANSAIGQQSQNIPYGTRFLAGLVASNCVGGSIASNARRFGVLISRNPKTLRTEVIQRSIEELVRSADRDIINPFLMPDDSIACYDSGITDAKEFANVMQSLLLPFQTTHSIKPW